MVEREVEQEELVASRHRCSSRFQSQCKEALQDQALMDRAWMDQA